MSMDRIYLHVPPEEYAEVKGAGASWDNHSKVWYIESNVPSTAFSRWLEGTQGEAEFGITSDEAYVASAQTACMQCGVTIEVICIYCQSGTDMETGDSMARFTVSNIWAMDDALAAQLEVWPYLKPIELDRAVGNYANHCPHCGEPQEDYFLHDEPGDIFFAPLQAKQGMIELTPLVGHIQLSGDFTCDA
jgi:uncharacterized protein DUF5710